MTWICHICGRERPDAKISVFSRTKVIPGTSIEMTENVRYCNDKPECAEAAKTFTFA